MPSCQHTGRVRLGITDEEKLHTMSNRTASAKNDVVWVLATDIALVEIEKYVKTGEVVGTE